ncbi:MAG TPA: cytochrome P450 [Bryobacteraceae bacterium]|nr:cytochrome P450 [Bryobacteraceae bacterium]
MLATAPSPPVLKGRPFIGSLPEFRRNPPQFLLKVAREHGDIAQFRLGPQVMCSITRPEWIKDILVTHQSNFIKSRMLERAKVLLGEGLLTSEGEFHTRQRRLSQPAFHRDRLIGYGAAMVDCAMKTRNAWGEGAKLDIAREMNHLTLAIVARTLFSADVSAEADEIRAALTDVLGLFEMVLSPFSEWFEKLPLPSVRRFERARDRLDKTIYRLIAERRTSGRDAGDLLSMLLLAQDEDDGGVMTDKQVRDEALTLFLAGHETTANALAWTWYLLSQNPEAETRFHAEIDRVLAGRAPAFEDLPQLKYVEMVFAEAMRLYPPAWTVGRRNLLEYRVGDYLIPPRTVIMMSTYAVHRDPRWFPEPDRFLPERFLPEAVAARPKFSYFPFGGGARVCIGERFAWMEGVLLLAVLGQKWRPRLAPEARVETRAMITLRPKYGMPMIVEAR